MHTPATSTAGLNQWQTLSQFPSSLPSITTSVVGRSSGCTATVTRTDCFRTFRRKIGKRRYHEHTGIFEELLLDGKGLMRSEQQSEWHCQVCCGLDRQRSR
jgi:hypothetical protein